MSGQSLEEMLRSVPIFGNLGDDQLRALADMGGCRSWEQDQVVFREGDMPNSLFLILSGKVRIHKRQKEGREIQLAILDRGHFFGEMALFDGAPRSATVSTLEPCEFFVLDRENFFALLPQSPVLFREVMAGISGKLRAGNEQFFWEVLEKQRLRAEMEKERHRSLAQMVAGVAHEINTPLGIVNTAASFLTESLTGECVSGLAKDEESRVLLEDIAEAGRLIQANLARASRLVQSFKNLSISQIIETKERRELPELIEEIVTLFKPQARAARLEIEMRNELPEGTGEWVGYGGHLSQVVLNLLSNIERYAYPKGQGGPVQINLSADSRADRPSFVVAVRDFGGGIAPQDLPKVCEAFFTTGRAQGGTGLGLAIVHNLVTGALKGTLEIQSQPGQGTTVVVAFPQVIPDDEEPAE